MFGIDDMVLATVGSNILSNVMSGNRQESAQDFSAAQYATRYQTQVKDLQAAGLSPMLAYSQGPGSAPTGQAAPVTDLMQGVSQTSVNTSQKAINEAQVKKIEADTSASSAQAAASAAQAAKTQVETQILQDTQPAYNQALTTQATASAGQSVAATDKLREEIKNVQAQKELILAQAKQANAQAKVAPTVQALNQVEARLKSLQVPAAENEASAEGSWWKRNVAPYLSDVGKVVSSAFGMLRMTRLNKTRITTSQGTTYDSTGAPSGGHSTYSTITER